MAVVFLRMEKGRAGLLDHLFMDAHTSTSFFSFLQGPSGVFITRCCSKLLLMCLFLFDFVQSVYHSFSCLWFLCACSYFCLFRVYHNLFGQQCFCKEVGAMFLGTLPHAKLWCVRVSEDPWPEAGRSFAATIIHYLLGTSNLPFRSLFTCFDPHLNIQQTSWESLQQKESHYTWRALVDCDPRQKPLLWEDLIKLSFRRFQTLNGCGSCHPALSDPEEDPSLILQIKLPLGGFAHPNGVKRPKKNCHQSH